MVKVIFFLPYIFQVLYVLCFTRPRYQVSFYSTIGPLVYHEVLLASIFTNLHNSEHLKYFFHQYSPLFQNKA